MDAVRHVGHDDLAHAWAAAGLDQVAGEKAAGASRIAPAVQRPLRRDRDLVGSLVAYIEPMHGNAGRYELGQFQRVDGSHQLRRQRITCHLDCLSAIELRPQRLG